MIFKRLKLVGDTKFRERLHQLFGEQPLKVIDTDAEFILSILIDVGVFFFFFFLF